MEVCVETLLHQSAPVLKTESRRKTVPDGLPLRTLPVLKAYNSLFLIFTLLEMHFSQL